MPLKLVIVYATKFVGIASEVLRQGSTRVAEKATKVGVTEGQFVSFARSVAVYTPMFAIEFDPSVIVPAVTVKNE